jgi:multiple sugar transport system permease protein
MCGIFAGLASDDRRRDAAWKYIEYFDGTDARRIRTESLVEGGLGPFVRRRLLERFNVDGRYDAVLRQVSPEMEEMYKVAFEGGVPEPYGKNCGDVYNQMNRPLGAIWASDVVRDAIDRNQPDMAKAEIRAILKRGTAKINETMLGHVPAPVQARENSIAWMVIVAVALIFVLVMRRVTRVFTSSPLRGEGRGEGSSLVHLSAKPGQATPRAAIVTVALSLQGRGKKNRIAYLLMAPALISIALWMYWPLARGSLIAFQNYSVIGKSQFVGAQNFASVLFNEEFWYSLKLSVVYAILFIFIGFWVPIALALLLQEVPRGKTLFRTIFYLPAVLSGVVVIFLWKSFYSPDGLVNQALNVGIWLLNFLPHVHISEFNSSWLEQPGAALLCTLIPTIWVSMGPGCLIYLAALKTVPDELYEAADIDGAGIRRKIANVALPSIRSLVAINFIGAVIGAVRGASAFVLAMTGGGPFGEHGGATEVIGLKIFYTTFGQLQFGVGAAMAWVLGSMLIGFTVLQLQRLSRIEFRTAPVAGAGAR